MANLEDFETTDLLSELKRRYNCLGKPQGNFVFLGPPGSGKGTQSHILKNSHCYCHLSTGDLFREAIKSGTPTGLKAKEFTDKGLLAPDDLTLSLIQERINSPKCRRGFLLDGYPRNISQAKDLSKLLKSVGKKLNGVFSFNASDEVIEKRVVGRLVHPGSNRVYHKVFKPPKEEGKDDLTGEPLVARKDDSPDIIRKRLEVYKRETAPLIEYYNKENLHHSVNANNSVESITKEVEKLVLKTSKV